MSAHLTSPGNRPLHILLICVLALMLSACGFQLRGSAALPEEMSVTYIDNNKPYGSLMDDFAEALRIHNVTVTDERSEATAVLKIISTKREKQVLSVNSSGKVLEFQLRQTIQFSVATTDKIPLLELQRITVTRNYLFNSNQVLSKEREQAVVRRDLQKELVNMALLRMAAAR